MAYDRIMVVTGAGSGIGAATALRAAAPGVAMVLHTGGRHPDSAARLDAVALRCREAGAECVPFLGNLDQAGVATRAVELALETFGPVDTVVHAAGMVRKSPFGELSVAELELCMAVMPYAFTELVTAALPGLTAATQGRVVAVSSFIAHRQHPHSIAPASAAAKAALETLAKCLALQLAPTGTTVNCVIPGYIQKDEGRVGSLSVAAWREAADLTPKGCLGTPDDVASAILFLLSPAARHITGTTLAIDGGLMLG